MRRDRGSASVVVLGVIVALFLIGGIIVGGYQLNWWLKGNAVQHNSVIFENGRANQIALVDQINQEVRDAQQAGIPAAQKKAIIADICDASGRLTGTVQVNSASKAFIGQEC